MLTIYYNNNNKKKKPPSPPFDNAETNATIYTGPVPLVRSVSVSCRWVVQSVGRWAGKVCVHRRRTHSRCFPFPFVPQRNATRECFESGRSRSRRKSRNPAGTTFRCCLGMSRRGGGTARQREREDILKHYIR